MKEGCLFMNKNNNKGENIHEKHIFFQVHKMIKKDQVGLCDY
jgi:hypothetical protein